MKKTFKKMISVILCLTIAFSVCATGSFAAEKRETVAVSYEEDLSNLDMDYPVILVTGMQDEFYKGLSTETEKDDVRIWGPEVGVILKVVFANLGKLIMYLLTENYSAIAELGKDICADLFGDVACDENGIPNPDTGKKTESTLELQEGYGYENYYEFIYDWRYDMHTVAVQLDEYIEYVMELTETDKVALVAMSMGNAVLTTYLYEYYYTNENYSERNHIAAAVFVAGAMNGVGTCEDPFSGNMSVDSTSLMRMMSEVMMGNAGTKILYYMLEMLYSMGALDPLTEYVDSLTQNLLTNGFNDAVCDTIGTIPGFYALMSTERYEQARDYVFNTPEKRAKYAAVIEKSDYYHYTVQANNQKVIQSLIDDGINTAVFAEYGCTFIPITSDNDRMSDGTIATDRESFGATCAEVDGTLGDGYAQAKECACGKNHISADNQIDASTCAFPDITWFGKYLRHTADEEFIGDLVNLVVYSDKQITVWTYADLPQYLINLGGGCLVPLTADNAGKILPYEETTLKGKFLSLFE